MGLLGSGSPLMVMNGAELEFPDPSQGDAASPYVFEGKSGRNILGENVKISRKWRFKRSYRFVALSQTIYDRLVAAYNSGSPVRWYPHIDVPIISYLVHIENLSLKPYQGLALIDDVIFDVEGVSTINKIPSIDNMITGHYAFNKGV